jgi:hypothetical protein
MFCRLEPRDSGRKPGLDIEWSLDALIELHEATDWTDAPGVTATEAAAWTQRLIDAREQARWSR